MCLCKDLAFRKHAEKVILGAFYIGVTERDNCLSVLKRCISLLTSPQTVILFSHRSVI